MKRFQQIAQRFMMSTCLLLMSASVMAQEPVVSFDKADEWTIVYDVSNMIEGIYDNNQDGVLADLEVLYFLRDVMNAARRNGRFEVVSPILEQYDDDGDGWVSAQEADKIEAFLY